MTLPNTRLCGLTPPVTSSILPAGSSRSSVTGALRWTAPAPSRLAAESVIRDRPPLTVTQSRWYGHIVSYRNTGVLMALEAHLGC